MNEIYWIQWNTKEEQGNWQPMEDGAIWKIWALGIRNNYKEDRAGLRDELVRRLNIRNLGIPYKIKPEAECITTNPSLSSMHPSSSWYLDWTILVFSLFFFSKIYQVSLILVSLHLQSSMLKVPLSPPPILSYCCPSFRFQIKATSSQRPSLNPQ